MRRTSAPINVNNAHWTVAGMTGSGKSVLATELITNADRAVMVGDPKGDFEWPQAFARPEERRPVVVAHVADIPGVLRGNTRRDVIYRPDAMENQNPDAWAAFFEFGYNRRNTLIYLDEVYHVTDLRRGALQWYNACLTRGRSRGVFVGSSTQRPARIPLTTITEAKHLFIFQLHYVEDRKRLAANAGRDEFLLTPQDAYREVLRKRGVSERNIELLIAEDAAKFAFFHYEVGTDKPRLYKGLELTPKRRPVGAQTVAGVTT